MKLIIVFLMLFLTACNSSNTESAENVNTEVTEEQKYIDLIVDEDYDTVAFLTQGKNNKIQEDYYKVASVLNDLDRLNNNIHNLGAYDLEANYYNALKDLESLEYIPEKVKEKVEEVKSISQNQKEKYAEEILKQGFKTAFEKEVENRTLNPQSVSIGMTKEEVLTEGWGKPNDINRTITANSTSEQWVYNNYKYLYFEDGFLTTIQD